MHMQPHHMQYARVQHMLAAESMLLGVLHLQNTVELSEEQIQDLLHLRRLFCGKIGQLARARRSLLSQLPSESIGMSHASDKLDQVTSLAEQLRVNGSEEYRTYMQFASTFYRGVGVHDCCTMPPLTAVASLGLQRTADCCSLSSNAKYCPPPFLL